MTAGSPEFRDMWATHNVNDTAQPPGRVGRLPCARAALSRGRGQRFRSRRM
ncbi:hypothetical protein [Nocardia sp. NPDC005998]|uniref:hypothetical protein n=1 Tax=Nocardia sp. NPDC005998 TaxID=3156894 RepID=UPI0033B2A2E5